jgi:putative aldouronate transport system permease protein
MRARKNKELSLHMMLLPGVILVLLFSYGPMLGIVMAFQEFVPTKGIFKSSFNGWDNFLYVMELPGTFQVLFNTVNIAVMKIIAGIVVPVTVALLLNELRRSWLRRGVQTLIYLPYFMSWIILGGILIDILSPSHGIVGRFLGLFGIEPIFFLGDNRWFPYVLVISNEWKEFGFSSIVYLAALTGINPSLYEAAVVDGAGRWKQTRHITLPGILPIIILLTTLSLGQILNAGFDQVFNLYSPQVYESGDILDTLVYRIGLIDAQYGVAAAIGLFKSVISFFFIVISYWMAYRLANYRIF